MQNTIATVNTRTNSLTTVQIENLRRKAAANLKAHNRAAKHNVTPPKSVYRGTGNVPALVKSALPHLSPASLKFVESKVHEFANMHNSGDIPGENDIKLLAHSLGLKVPGVELIR